MRVYKYDICECARLIKCWKSEIITIIIIITATLCIMFEFGRKRTGTCVRPKRLHIQVHSKNLPKSNIQKLKSSTNNNNNKIMWICLLLFFFVFCISFNGGYSFFYNCYYFMRMHRIANVMKQNERRRNKKRIHI